MAWPAGTNIGGKPFRTIDQNELVGGVSVFTVPAASTVSLPYIPWWSGGFSKCRIQWTFTLAAGGAVQWLVRGVNDQDTVGAPNNELLQGASGETWPPGTSYMDMAFDDGVWPGSYLPVQVVPQGARGLSLNPTWNKAAMLQFSIQNNTAGLFTLDALSILLGS